MKVFNFGSTEATTSCYLCSDSAHCDTYDQDYCAGIRLRFGKPEVISELTIQCAPEWAALPGRKTNVTSRFRGRTLQFFRGEYSIDLRLNLFGPEHAQDQVSDGQFGDKLKDVRYLCSTQGFTVRVSPEGYGSPNLNFLR
jgi:hypothetical protein